MATYRLEFDASGEPLLIEEENGEFKTPLNDLALPDPPTCAEPNTKPLPPTKRAA